MRDFTVFSPADNSTSIRSAILVRTAFSFNSLYATASIACSPPSCSVRNVNKSGISPVISHSLRKTCSMHSNENTSSYQSTLHSTTSAFACTALFAFSKISGTVFPTIGTQIFGIPVPISKFLTFIVFIVCFPPWITVLYLLYLILKNPARAVLFLFSQLF